MSAVDAKLTLQGLTLESADSEYEKDGFHHRHTCAANGIIKLAEAFRSAGYHLEMLTAEDCRADEQKMRVVYTFNRFEAVDRHVVFVDAAGDIPGAEAPSLCGVYPAADWFEREVFDMYGVQFPGHPDLKRILLPDDADFHALLKDFGRPEDAEAPSEAS